MRLRRRWMVFVVTRRAREVRFVATVVVMTAAEERQT
jgi:hypothetical protein